MKFTINQQSLSKALNIVSKAVTSRTTLPIMKGILLKVNDDNTLTMSASDLYLSIEKTVEVKDAEPGSIVVLSKLFGDIVRKLPNGDIKLELIGENLKIECNNIDFNIVGLSADEFPIINKIEYLDQTSIVLNREMIKDMIKKTSFSASIDESKGVITGVLIEMEKESINLIALDGFRMAITRHNMINDDEKKIIISAKIINELNKILIETTEEEYDVKLVLTEKKTIFLLGKTKVILSLLDGEFIKYRDILPKEFTTNVIVNRSDLLNSIERASLLAKEGKNNLIKFIITDGFLNITSKSEEGNVEEKILINKKGDDLEIGFNSKYVLDVLKVIEDEEIELNFNKSISPCIVKPIDGNNYDYLILPVRITSNI